MDTRVLSAMLNPSTLTSPEEGFDNPLIMLIVVVFPDPFGPNRPKISPYFTLNDRLSTAVMSPKRFVNPPSSKATAFRSSITLFSRSCCFPGRRGIISSPPYALFFYS